MLQMRWPGGDAAEEIELVPCNAGVDEAKVQGAGAGEAAGR